MKNLLIAIVMVMMLGLGVAMAQEQTGNQTAVSDAPVADDSFTPTTVSGDISGIAKRTISIVYERDYDNGTEYEILIPVDKQTQYKHKKDLSELKVGDLVSVEYEKPGETSKHKARAITVTFIQSAATGLVSKE